ncbi:MAG TPA: carbamoyltransferase HypF [Bacillota bacterium]|nr:carbamoyltransferase HypF [Bacillota bacterium]
MIINIQSERWRFTISGLVQGVGFRPFLYNLAQAKGLTGWVRNNYAGVELEVQGSPEDLASFQTDLPAQAPAAAVIASMTKEVIPVIPETDFTIQASASGGIQGSPLPDQGICEGCCQEFFSPKDSRFRHPFNSCTLCGPRFTIMEALPFDRVRTSMNQFPLCPHCQKEYITPSDRRFHAQTIACPECGPKLWFAAPDGTKLSDTPSSAAYAILSSGGILGVKGIGGYHLACNAYDDKAVSRLRTLKGRDNRAFAVLFQDLDIVTENCEISLAETEILTGPARPILLLPQKNSNRLARGVNPGLREIGAFLPYTGIQLLLFTGEIEALVMTSGNRSGEPLTIDDSEAIRILGPMVDGLLIHDRIIHWRCDDSVLRYQQEKIIGIRRARGFVPAPVRVNDSLPPLLACGPQQKNTFALTNDNLIYLSSHQGDLDHLGAYLHYRENVAQFIRLLGCTPEWIVHDLHPDYLSTTFAKEYASSNGLNTLGVQHHLAHIAQVIACQRITGPVMGIAMDGSGYGTDQKIWGGEFFYGEGVHWRRIGHLKYYPLPGGEMAIHEPWRMAAAYLENVNPEGLNRWLDTWRLKENWNQLRGALKLGINSPETSSMGRFFDGVAALIGGITSVSYEGEAAIWLENQADPLVLGAYDFQIEKSDGTYLLDPQMLITQIIKDLSKVSRASISMKFHRTIAAYLTEMAGIIRRQTSIGQVLLSGGVFQNRLLLDLTCDMLRASNFLVHVPDVIPVNDGGISLGQAWLGGLMIKRGVSDVFSDTW